jgi:hypothetical protein
MKKILFFSIATVLCVSANAQLHKGRVLLSGNLAGSISTRNIPGAPDYVEERDWSVIPGASYFFKANQSVGVQIGYGHSKTGYSEGENWSGAVSLNRYFPLGKNFFLAAHTQLAFRKSHLAAEPIVSDYSTHTNQFNATLYPGVSYVAANRFLLEAGISSLIDLYYKHEAFEGPSRQTRGTFGLSTSVGNTNPLYISFNILLGK